MTGDSQPEQYMREALALARKGIALASPNPRVGAIIVDDSGVVIGRGFHSYDGVKHAEVLALEEAGSRAKNATLYLNLEPCSHHGRTGPCADAVIAAGIKRVFAAMQDPNPLVSGRGFEKLRAAGIEVHVGLLEVEAKELNEAFAKYVRSKLPLVTLKAGMTLDGKIAPPPRDPLVPETASTGWITSAESHAHVQVLRHQSDAIMVGVGTVIADDPLLTDRSGLPRRRRLLRVILDSRLRLPLESRLVKTANADLLVFCSFAEEKRKAELESRGVQVCQVVPARVGQGKEAGHPDLAQVMRKLGEMEITSLLIEGGANVNWVALEAGLVDKVFLYYAPKILAGTASVPLAGGRGFQGMQDASKVKIIRLHRFGEDFAVEGYLKDPYME